MRKKATHILVLCLFLLLTMACSLFEKAKKDEPEDAGKLAAKTVEAMFTMTSFNLTLLPQPTDTPTAIPPTATESASATPVPSATQTPVPPTPTNTAIPLPCNKAKFESDVTIPDGTTFDPSKNFTKTWRITNVGSCTWTSNYQLIYASGNQMSAPASVWFPRNVAPGESVDLSINLVSPNTAGDYTTKFKLKANDGTVFGVGDRDAALTVVIKVKGSSTNTPNPLQPTNTPLPSTGCEIYYDWVDMWTDGRFDAHAELVNTSSTTWDTNYFVIVATGGATDKIEDVFYNVDTTYPGKSFYFITEGYDENKGQYDFTIFWSLMDYDTGVTYCSWETRYVRH